MDKIILPEMQFYGYHGVFPQEKKVGQPFIVSVEMSMDLKPAGCSDDLTLTVNYAEAYEEIRKIAEEEQFDLIETLAERVAQRLLDNYPLSQVKVIVDKPVAPRTGGTLAARIEIIREKHDEK